MLAATSVWNQRLGDPPIDPNSATYVASVAGKINKLNFLYRTNSFAYYWATEATPRQKVWLDVKDGNQPKLRVALESVPIPPGLRPPGIEGDRVVIICCRKADGSIEYFELHKMHRIDTDPALEVAGCSTLNEPGWHCDAATAIKDMRKNPGYITAEDWPGGVDIGSGGTISWGNSAAKTIMYHHAIRISEAQKLYIPHALRFAIPKDLHRPEARFPALASDGTSVNPAHPPTGAIFTFDNSDTFPDVKNAFVKAVCEAIRDFGMILTDSTEATGTGAAMKCESKAMIPNSREWGTDAWKGVANKAGSPGAIFTELDEEHPENETSLLGKQIPLVRLEVVDASYFPLAVAPGMLGKGM